MNVDFLLFIMFGVFYIVIQDQIAFLDVLKQAGEKYRDGWAWIRQNFAKIISDETQINEAWATHSLILLNLAAFTYSLALGYDSIVRDFSFIPAKASEYWRWLTHQFLHANQPVLEFPFSIHLLTNMVYLYVFGDNVESVFRKLADRIGTTLNLYAGFYLVGGVVAVVVQSSVIGWSSYVMLIGASGAISAVLGAYVSLFPRNMVKFAGVSAMPAMVFFVLWFTGQIVGGEAEVAYMAHVGGFVYGLVVGVFLRLREKQVNGDAV